jgi:glycosyltransferase involved in cell wall biosynthesis
VARREAPRARRPAAASPGAAVSHLKITFLVPHLRIAGGVRAILTYADLLTWRGHQVSLVVPAGGAAAAWWRNRRAAPPDWMPAQRARIVWVARWSPELLPDGDVVVATAWQSAPVVAVAPPRCGAKFYLVQHYESLYHGEPAVVDATYRLPLTKVVISTWLRDVMRERFGDEAEVLVTPVDRGLFHRVPSVTATSRPRVLMLHHEYAWKGVADGLAAVARVKVRVPSLSLVGFGVKPPRRPLPYDEFHANPPQDALAALYSGCDIYLCPSWDEGLGMPAMEAMACGAALATYDNGGCRDYARDGETALVVPRRDVSALTVALERLVTDEALRIRVAAAGALHVTTVFDWERAASRLEELFRRSRPGAGRA